MRLAVSRHQFLRFSCFVALLLAGVLGCVRGYRTDTPLSVDVRVVDERGGPVSGVEIGSFFGATSLWVTDVTNSNGEAFIRFQPSPIFEKMSFSLSVPHATTEAANQGSSPAGSFSIQLEEGRTSYRVTTTLGYVSDFDSEGRLISRTRM